MTLCKMDEGRGSHNNLKINERHLSQYFLRVLLKANFSFFHTHCEDLNRFQGAIMKLTIIANF